MTVAVSDLASSKRFYEQAFTPLGYRLSFGEEGRFWAFDIGDGLFEIMRAEEKSLLTRIHVAFRAKSKAEVRASGRPGRRCPRQWRPGSPPAIHA